MLNIDNADRPTDLYLFQIGPVFLKTISDVVTLSSVLLTLPPLLIKILDLEKIKLSE